MNKDYPKDLSQLLSPIKNSLNLIVVLAVLGSLFLVVAPIAITVAIKLYKNNVDGFILWIVIAGVGVFLRQLFHMASLGYAHLVEVNFRKNLRQDFVNKLSKLPLGWFVNTPSGNIRKLVSDDIIKIHTIIAHSYSEASSAITLPLACMLAMLFYEWRTGLIVILIIVLLLLVGMIWMSKNSYKAMSINDEYTKAQNDMSHAAIEMVDGIKEIKNYGLVESVFSRFDEAVKRFSNTSYQWLNSAAKPMAFMTSAIQPAIITTLTILVCFITLQLGWINIEGVVLFVLLATALPSSLISLAQLSNFIRDGKLAADTLLVLYATKEQEYKVETTAIKAGDIVFNNVDFSYDTKERVLKIIDCTIPHGQITALVGPSGGGKTTMARLIARFWDVDSGSITINGVNVKDASLKELLENISLVFQDVSLMHASVAENIALSCPSADLETIVEAAKNANIHQRIMGLPDGYDSIIGENGVFLSGGERQRITIARAFLANAPILILDEATAQSDAESEAEIQSALSKLSANKTLIIIAHRLQTIINAHQILVINNGEIVQKGDHHKLLKESGIYQNMWKDQNQTRGAES